MSHLFLQISWVLEKAQISELVDEGNLLPRQQATKDFFSLSKVLLVSETVEESQRYQMNNPRQWPNPWNSHKKVKLPVTSLEESLLIPDLHPERERTFVEVRISPCCSMWRSGENHRETCGEIFYSLLRVATLDIEQTSEIAQASYTPGSDEALLPTVTWVVNSSSE